jgi:hypothetical protein
MLLTIAQRMTVSHTAYGNTLGTQDVDFGRMICLKFLVDYYVLIYTHCEELM